MIRTAVVALVSLGFLACTPKEEKIPVKLTATLALAPDGETETAHIEVDTLPGALVAYDDRDISHVTVPDIVADERGHAVIDVPKLKIDPKDEAADALVLHVMAMRIKKPLIGKPSVGNGEGEIEVKRPVHLTYLGKCIGCGNKARFSWRLDSIDVEGLPAGTKIALAGKTVTVAQPAKSVPFDGGAVLAGLSIAHNPRGRPTMTTQRLPLVITLPSGVKVTKTIPVPVANAEQYLVKARAKPLSVLKFPGEGATGGRHGVLVSKVGLEYYGPPSKIGEVDLAAAFEISTRSRSCGRYVNTKTKETKGGSASMLDVAVTVWERRTGKKVGYRKFLAPPASCGGTASTSMGVSSGVSAGGSSYDPKDVAAYLTSIAR